MSSATMNRQQLLWFLVTISLFTPTRGLLSPTIRRSLSTRTSRHTRTSRVSLSVSSPQVLCVGDALFDCIANDEARGLSVAEMVERGDWTAFPGGAPANVATACRKLGTTSAFCGCVGNDPDGDALEALFHQVGVDTTWMQRSESLPTRRVMVTRSMTGDREFGGFFKGRQAHQFADAQLDYATSDGSNSLLDSTEWIVSSTLSLAFPAAAKSIHSLVQDALTRGAQLYVDINWRPVFWPDTTEAEARDVIVQFAQQATVVKMTDEEAAWLLEGTNVTASDALTNPTRVHDCFPQAKAVFVTAGEKGVSYSFRLPKCSTTITGHVPSFDVDVTETTGAGDAFTAAILTGILSRGWDLQSCDGKQNDEMESDVEDLVRFAAAVGSLTCTKEGAIASQPTMAEVESFLIHGEKVWA